MSGSYYRSLGEGRYESTVHAQGAWNPGEQHMAPVAGLLVQNLLDCEPRPDLQLARVGFDILGMIPGGEFEISTRVLRPGRTIELLEAELRAQGRTAVTARAWRLARTDTAEVAALEDPDMPGPDEAGPYDGMTQWPGGFIESLEFRVVPGHRPGRGRIWLRTPLELVDDGPTPDLVRLCGMVDAANGIAARVRPGTGSWMFPNVDLQLHFHRPPSGSWLGLDTRVTFGADGVGLTSSVLHDLDGPFGRSEQILTVRPL
ncbi:thioesterase family protein [Arthrobacter frigidicola]|nr:thioesterase family protein [Arthrobacter frigidicola]